MFKKKRNQLKEKINTKISSIKEDKNALKDSVKEKFESLKDENDKLLPGIKNIIKNEVRQGRIVQDVVVDQSHMKTVAMLKVIVIEGEDLKHPDAVIDGKKIVSVNFENNVAVSSPIVEGPFLFNFEAEFEVKDISSDICVKVYDRIAKDELFGQVIIPVSGLVGRDGGKTTEEWYEFFPLKAEKFHNTIPKTPNSGMKRPKRSIGFVKIHVDLNLLVPFYEAYTMQNLRMEKQEEANKEREIEIDTLKDTIARLERVISTPRWV